MYGAPWSLTIAFERSLSGGGTRALPARSAATPAVASCCFAAGATHPTRTSTKSAAAQGLPAMRPQAGRAGMNVVAGGARAAGTRADASASDLRRAARSRPAHVHDPVQVEPDRDERR